MRIASVTLLALAAACSGPRVHVSPASEAETLDLDDEDTVAVATDEPRARSTALPIRTACYFGELMVTKAGESETNQGALLVKLTMDQNRSQMVEETWSFPLYERYVITRTIRGSAFHQRQDDGSFAGTGKLEGQPWIWNRWTATTTSADQNTRVESDTQFEDGALVTRERVLDAGGTLRVAIRHSLDEIPLDECDNMFAKARSNAAKLRAASAAN